MRTDALQNVVKVWKKKTPKPRKLGSTNKGFPHKCKIIRNRQVILYNRSEMPRDPNMPFP